MVKLILFDRDGVLNRELGGYVTDVPFFEVLPHVLPNLIKLKRAGFRFVIITNQSGIAKGIYTHEILDAIHHKLKAHVAEAGIAFDEIYYCPHHPDYSRCICRKPQSGMIEKALARFGVKPEEAIMIGDTPRDIEAAEAAGVKTFKISPNEDWTPIAESLLS